MKEENLPILLKKAKALERGRYLLYRKSAARVFSPDAKDMLIFLMNAEKRHLAILEQEILKLKRTKKLDLKTALGGQLKAPFATKFGRDVRGSIGDINVLEAALEHEKEDPVFYAMLAGKTKRKDAKRLFLELKRQERMHLSLLNRKLKELRRISVLVSESQGHKFLG